jgi:hypothetical protein
MRRRRRPFGTSIPEKLIIRGRRRADAVVLVWGVAAVVGTEFHFGFL